MARAQAAMEFLMTYGWVIMIVLVTIGVLNYFGVFGIQNLIPEKCELGPGLECVDYHISESGATIVVQNALGKEITFTGLSISKKGDQKPICSIRLSDNAPPVAVGAKATLICNELFASHGKETFIPAISFRMSGEDFSVEGVIYTAPEKTEAKETVPFFEKAQQEPTAEICDNIIDDDNDGSVDCKDTDCSNNFVCAAQIEVCNNKADDDGDKLIDCVDGDCSTDPACA